MSGVTTPTIWPFTDEEGLELSIGNTHVGLASSYSHLGDVQRDMGHFADAQSAYYQCISVQTQAGTCHAPMRSVTHYISCPWLLQEFRGCRELTRTADLEW